MSESCSWLSGQDVQLTPAIACTVVSEMSLQNLGHMQWAAMERAVLGEIVKGG